MERVTNSSLITEEWCQGEAATKHGVFVPSLGSLVAPDGPINPLLIVCAGRGGTYLLLLPAMVIC